jgi:phosphoglycerate dehydrogenase-like enzyme
VKKICITNISKDEFWQMPKLYQETLVDSFRDKAQFHFIESTAGMRESLKDCDMIIGMPFSKGAVRKNQNLERVHFWTAQVPLSWQDSGEIEVSSSSGVNSESVAEHGLYLMMKALRGEVGHEDLLHDDFLVAQTPKNMTCGIVGLGNIGESLIKLIRPLFGSVNALSRTQKDIEGLDKFYSLVQMEEFYKDCDYIVFCLPLTSETSEYFKGEGFYSNLKKNAVLVNLSRGELFDESEMTQFLSTHSHARYLTDVTYPEPYPEDGALRDLDNIFITPHIGGRRDDIWDLLTKRTIEELNNWI